MLLRITTRVLPLMIIMILFTACEERVTHIQTDVRFHNEEDGIWLAGTLTTPPGEGPYPAVVLISGSGPNDRDLPIGEHKLFLTMARHLARDGIASLRYDKRGVGESQGNYEAHHVEAFTRDGAAAVSFLISHEMVQPEQVGVLGLSNGGLVAPRVALAMPGVDYVVLMATPGVWGQAFAYESSLAIAKASKVDESKLRRLPLFYEELWTLYEKPELTDDEEFLAKRLLNEIAGFMDAETRMYMNLDDLDSYWDFMRSEHILESMREDPVENLRLLDCPVMAITGSLDVQVPPGPHLAAIERALQEGGNENYLVKELPRMNHLFQRARTGLPQEYTTSDVPIAHDPVNMIADWIKDVIEE